MTDHPTPSAPGARETSIDHSGGWRIVAEEGKVAIFAPDGSSVAVSGMDFAAAGYGDSLICRLLWALDTPAHSIYCQSPAGRLAISQEEGK